MKVMICVAVLACATLAGVAACGGDRHVPSSPTPSPPTPSPPAPSSPTPAIVSLAIGGTTSSAGVDEWLDPWLGMVPGETARLTATARFSDNTERDVTAETAWSCDPPGMVSIASPGVILARAPGWASLAAKYGSVRSPDGLDRAEVRVRVAPEGIYLLGVAVDDGRRATADAFVEVTSAAGTFSTWTDVWGIVFLPAVGDTVVKVAKAGYVAVKTSTTVTKDQFVEYTLQPSGATQSVATR